jgi:hypothetical protein
MTSGKRKEKPTYDEIGLRADQSQFYTLKALFEQLFGHPVYLNIKETASMPHWKKEVVRLLDAVEFSIKSTVVVVDDEWLRDVGIIIENGKNDVRRTEKISDLFAQLIVALTRIVFMQIGGVPHRHYSKETVPFRANFWTLTAYRGVQYVQTTRQKDNLNSHPNFYWRPI